MIKVRFNFGYSVAFAEGLEMSQTILVVDDDRKTVEIVKLYLEKNNYRVLVAYDGLEAVEIAIKKRPDLVVLDLMLPGIDGLEVCHTLQVETKAAVLMLTARTTEEDRLVGFATGADDYLVKPFSPRELVARVRAVLKRATEKVPEQLKLGNFFLDTTRHEIWLKEQQLKLTPSEFKLLQTFLQHPGRVFTRLDLAEQVFGLNYEGLERTLDSHIRNIRKKIEPDPDTPIYIQTVYGVGYKFYEETTNVE
jgi:DNA-binding response OmpR family regulator